MSLDLNPYWQSLAAPWRQRGNGRDWLGPVSMVATLVILCGVILFAGGFTRKAIVISALVLIMLTTHIFWMLHIVASMHLNQPASVLLVPRYLRAQRRTLLALWLALALLQTGALVGAHALGLKQPMDSPALWLLACSGGLLFWVLAMRWGFVVAPLCLLITFSPRLFNQTFSDRQWPVITLADVERYASWWAVPALATMAWALGRSALRPGDAAHRAQASRSANLLVSLGDQNPADVYRLSPRATQFITFFQTPFHRYASWLLAKPGSGPNNVLARAELGLGAKTHWVMQVVEVCAIVSAVGLVAYGYELVWGNAWQILANPVTILGLGGITLAPLVNWRNALLLTAKEQALMLLLPGMPQGVALNRALAKRHLCHLFLSWLAMTALVLCLPWSDAFRVGALLLIVSTLPLLPLVIQDWSRVAPSVPWQWVKVVLKGPLWMTGGLVVLHLLQVQMLWIGVVSAVVFAATVIWRWRRLAVFAQAFPVGHKANF